MKSPQFLSRSRACSYLNSPKRPEREWPWMWLILGGILAFGAFVIRLALQAMEQPWK